MIAAPAAQLPALYRAGLVEKPQVLGTNDLTLAVPARHRRVNGLDELGRPGVRLPSPRGPRRPPCGRAPCSPAWTPQSGRQRGFRVAGSAAVARLVRTHKADAGLTYATDAASAGLLGIDLPDYLARHVTYGVAVVKAAPHLRQARAFVAGLKTAGGHPVAAARRPGPRPG